MTEPKQSALLSQLPPALQGELAVIAGTARNSFGELRSLPHLVITHFSVIAWLLSECRTYARLAAVLAELGISRPDGQPFPPNSLSSAWCRARRRMSRRDAPEIAETKNTTHPGFESVSFDSFGSLRKATGPPAQKGTPSEFTNKGGSDNEAIDPGNARAAQILTAFRRPSSS